MLIWSGVNSVLRYRGICKDPAFFSLEIIPHCCVFVSKPHRTIRFLCINNLDKTRLVRLSVFRKTKSALHWDTKDAVSKSTGTVSLKMILSCNT